MGLQSRTGTIFHSSRSSGFQAVDWKFLGIISHPSVDSNDSVYITTQRKYPQDSGIALVKSVQKYTAGGLRPIAEWGKGGSGTGELQGGTGVAVNDTSGHIYVADFSGDKVIKYTKKGAFVLEFGSAGSGDGQFLSLQSLVVNETSGDVYTSEGDPTQRRIQQFSSSGVFIRKLDYVTGSVTTGIDIDSSGNVYVCVTAGGDGIRKFSSTLVELARFAAFATADITITNESGTEFLYIVDVTNDKVQKLTTAGVFVLDVGSSGSGNGQFLDPVTIYADSATDLFVWDNTKKDLQRFQNDGTFLGVIRTV